MAYNQIPSFVLLTLLVNALLSLSGHTFSAEARNLQETTLSKPELPKPELPTLPKPELPPLPEIPTLPKPDFPTLPEPEVPKMPELPPLPHIPDLPQPTLPTIHSLPKDLPIPFFSPPHSTTSP
ncbi:hypothetical protein QUC31_015036 [Theobroma cacao]|uniref:IgA FC receptor n=1 Tax=Theobroma cacao TaxID=3641 RepID=A0AB32VFC8_THECC|nr:PREDICTED: IgA FC receptor [Theobroma cacao]WRX15941.1 hypothetical protein QQP08_008428 [Theobroma cacao]